jgi:hypothetical protein
METHYDASNKTFSNVLSSSKAMFLLPALEICQRSTNLAKQLHQSAALLLLDLCDR